MTIIDIRIARNESDSKAASFIYAMSWKAAYQGIFSPDLLDTIPLDFWVTTFQNNFHTHRFEIAILSVEGEDVGAGGYGRSRDNDDPGTGEITSIYLLPQAWGKGYSNRLMDFMIAELNKKGLKKVHLWVLKESLRARHFYEKYGFKPTLKEKTITFKGETKIDIEYAL